MSRSKNGTGDAVYQGYYAPFLGMTGNLPQNSAVNRQAMIEQMYIQLLAEMAANRYKWKGLPESIDPRFLEVTLLQNALSVFYFDEEYGKFFALRGSPNGRWNMYNNPISFQVYGNEFISKTLRAMPHAVRARDDRGRFTQDAIILPEECIPIWANYLRAPDWNVILIYASRLAEFDRTIEINARSARRTRVIAIDPNMQLSVENMIRQIDEGQPVVKINQQTFEQTLGNLTSIDLGVTPKTIEELQLSRTRVWNECMGLLGINNANQDKKERLVASEVDANNDQVDSMRWVNLNARRQAAHMINKRYGLSLSVEFHNQQANAPEPMLQSAGEIEGGTDE